LKIGIIGKKYIKLPILDAVVIDVSVTSVAKVVALK